MSHCPYVVKQFHRPMLSPRHILDDAVEKPRLYRVIANDGWDRLLPERNECLQSALATD